MAAELMDTDMSHWLGDVRHYRVGDQDLAVEATSPVVPDGAEPMLDETLAVLGIKRINVTELLRDTLIFACTAEGLVIDLMPLHRFPPGTSHEDALSQAGLA